MSTQKVDPKTLTTVEQVKDAARKGQITSDEALDRQEYLLGVKSAAFVLTPENPLYGAIMGRLVKTASTGTRYKTIKVEAVSPNGNSVFGSLDLYEVAKTEEELNARLAQRIAKREERKNGSKVLDKATAAMSKTVPAAPKTIADAQKGSNVVPF